MSSRVLSAADVERVAADVAQLNNSCTVAEVVARGNVDADTAEAALAVLLQGAGGRIEVGGDDGASAVRYWFPRGFRRRYAASLVQARVLRAWRAAWPTVFYALRISIGLFLLPSFVLLAAAAAALAIAAISANSRGARGGQRRFLHGGGSFGGGLAQLRQLISLAFCLNPFFNRGGARGFAFGRRQQRAPYAYQRRYGGRAWGIDALAADGFGFGVGAPVGAVPRRRRIVTDGRLLTADETETLLRDQASRSRGGDGRGAAPAAGAAAANAGRRGAAVVNVGGAAGAPVGDIPFFEAIFSFVFGEGSPPPSEADCWALVAEVIAAHKGVVAAEVLLPYVLGWLVSADDAAKGGDPWMRAVIVRFRGKAVVHGSGALVYEFPLLMPEKGASDSESATGSEWVVVSEGEAGSPEQQATQGSRPAVDAPDNLPRSLERSPWTFTAASRSQVQRSVLLGVANVVLALWLGNYDVGAATTAQQSRGILAGHPILAFVVSLASRASTVILVFSGVFLAIPLARYLLLTKVLDPRIRRDNDARNAAAAALSAALQPVASPESPPSPDAASATASLVAQVDEARLPAQLRAASHESLRQKVALAARVAAGDRSGVRE